MGITDNVLLIWKMATWSDDVNVTLGFVALGVINYVSKAGLSLKF